MATSIADPSILLDYNNQLRATTAEATSDSVRTGLSSQDYKSAPRSSPQNRKEFRKATRSSSDSASPKNASRVLESRKTVRSSESVSPQNEIRRLRGPVDVRSGLDARFDPTSPPNMSSKRSDVSKGGKSGRSGLFGNLLCCLPRRHSDDDDTSKFGGSNVGISNLHNRRSSMELSRRKPSLDDSYGLGNRQQRPSLEARESIELTPIRRSRRISTARENNDDRGFLDRAFENATGINFSEHESTSHYDDDDNAH